MTGTSTRGPITAAKACAEPSPNTATATAIASSKLLEAAVNARVGTLTVVRSYPFAHVEADEEHDDEVDQQRKRHPEHIQGELDDDLPLQREHHEDREQQRDQRDRADAGHEFAVVPLLGHEAEHDQPCQDPGDERDAQVDTDAPRDLADADVDGDPLQAEHRGSTVMKTYAYTE